MDVAPTFGEYVRRLRRRKRWGLQELADSAGLSVSHLSRIENDNAVPNAESVVKLNGALEGDLGQMLELADCLPREILERYIRRAYEGESALRRAAGQGVVDSGFRQALVDEMDPDLRRKLGQHFRLSERDADGLYAVLRQIAAMSAEEREALLAFLSTSFRERER
jgi:transcriptional regulator with XRE-family HTH domain